MIVRLHIIREGVLASLLQLHQLVVLSLYKTHATVPFSVRTLS